MSPDEATSEQNGQIVDPHAALNREGAVVASVGPAHQRHSLPRRIVRVTMLPFRFLGRKLGTLLRRLGGCADNSGPDLHQHGNAYDHLFAFRIATLVPPQPVPPPDYSKQKLRAVTIAVVGIVLLAVVGGLTALSISLQNSAARPAGDSESSGSVQPLDPTARKALIDAATKPKPLEPGQAERVRKAMEALRKAQQHRGVPPGP